MRINNNIDLAKALFNDSDNREVTLSVGDGEVTFNNPVSLVRALNDAIGNREQDIVAKTWISGVPVQYVILPEERTIFIKKYNPEKREGLMDVGSYPAPYQVNREEREREAKAVLEAAADKGTKLDDVPTESLADFDAFMAADSGIRGDILDAISKEKEVSAEEKDTTEEAAGLEAEAASTNKGATTMTKKTKIKMADKDILKMVDAMNEELRATIESMLEHGEDIDELTYEWFSGSNDMSGIWKPKFKQVVTEIKRQLDEGRVVIINESSDEQAESKTKTKEVNKMTDKLKKEKARLSDKLGRGLGKTAMGLEAGVKKTGSGVKTAITKTGQGVQGASKLAGTGIRKVDEAAGTVIEKTASAANNTGGFFKSLKSSFVEGFKGEDNNKEA